MIRQIMFVVRIRHESAIGPGDVLHAVKLCVNTCLGIFTNKFTVQTVKWDWSLVSERLLRNLITNKYKYDEVCAYMLSIHAILYQFYMYQLTIYVSFKRTKL